MAGFKAWFTAAHGFLPQDEQSSSGTWDCTVGLVVLLCFLFVCFIVVGSRQGDLKFSKGLVRVSEVGGAGKSLIANQRDQME